MRTAFVAAALVVAVLAAGCGKLPTAPTQTAQQSPVSILDKDGK